MIFEGFFKLNVTQGKEKGTNKNNNQGKRTKTMFEVLRKCIKSPFFTTVSVYVLSTHFSS